jgi:hypothetical protein
MRNRQLHAALAAFAEEAAWQLAADTADGAEVPFEVVESSGRRRDTPLYCYRPLTAAFIDERIGILGRLPSYLPAVHALAALGGLDAYLEARGERRIPQEARERADATLRAFLARVFEDSDDFVLTPERLQRAYGELEEIVLDGRSETEVVVPLLGLAIESEEIAMGDGLALARGDAFDDPPDDAVWPRRGGAPNVLAVLRWEAAAGDEAPLDHARVRFRRLLTSLRLFDATGIAPGPVAWARTGGGPWHAFVLGAAAGLPRGTCPISAAQEDELRAFCTLVARRTPKSGELAWALARFEMACERRSPLEALTDHLLALRALLEPEGPGSGRVAGRVGALCATAEDRAALTERIAHAVSLERAAIAGLAPAEIGVAALVEEIGGHLRAILRDVLCGHLDSDLRSLADSLIADAAVEPSTAH